MGREQEATAPFIAAIDEVRAERDRLREALEWIVNAADRDAYEFANLAFERARSALSPESPCSECRGTGRVEAYAHGGLYTLAADGAVTGRVTDTRPCPDCNGTGMPRESNPEGQ